MKSKAYDHLKIEKKWQKYWADKKVYQAKGEKNKKKFYGLIEFPYPSGIGMHVGHIRSNTAMDIITRKRRMEGYNVLYPIGWDAFGLPTENYAIKTGQSPEKVTKQNTDNFRRQLQALGFGFDWSREINTTDPKYYKWTQWIFLQLLKNDLAYKKKMFINWCPKDQIGLANEEVVNGCCERCGTPVEKREKEQWMLAITKYADRLDRDLDNVDYLEKIKIQQRNWIGRSEGAEIDFKISGIDEAVKVFTTRPDTIYGATYLVLAPDHALISKLKSKISNWDKVQMYILETKSKNELERTKEDKEKTGVELKGVEAVNPATGEPIPVWIADYVLSTYGTGAIMAVPAHDERDSEFAAKFGLPVKQVINENGKLFNSGRFDGLDGEIAKRQITKFVGGDMVTKYKLRDWVFSRQRYWGEPIPVVFCDKCGMVPVPEKDLPVVLPKVKNYLPTDTGESPLANIKKWVNTNCPKCKGAARRETDTMPNWAGSSWYFLRYADPKNSKKLADIKKLKYWLGSDPRHGGVDWYNGGMEHTTLHLLYSRFWHKFLYDQKFMPTSEPYQKHTSHGLILADDGTKFSKSKGNGVDPLEIVKVFGADTLRLYEMFMGPFDQAVSWNSDALVGPRRFIERVYNLGQKILAQENSIRALAEAAAQKISAGLILPGVPGGSYTAQKFSVQRLLHKTIAKVSQDIEEMHFNTAVSSMMILLTEFEKANDQGRTLDPQKGPTLVVQNFKLFLQILSPFAPHVTEDLWFMLGEKKSIHESTWPEADKSKLVEDEVKIVVQVNGKVRAEMMVAKDANESDITTQALGLEQVVKFLGGQPPKKVIYVKNRLLSIVV